MIQANGLTKCKSDDDDCITRVANEILANRFQGWCKVSLQISKCYVKVNFKVYLNLDFRNSIR